MSGPASVPTASPDAPARPEVSARRLVLTLGLAGILAGALLVFVDQATRGPIAAHRREALAAAIRRVLGDPARIVSLRVADGRLVPDETTLYEVDTEVLDRVFLGFRDEAGREPIGFAIAYQKAGFQDTIRLIFGYDPRARLVLGMEVLESKETPGLGDKIEKDAGFVAGFEGRIADPEKGLVAVKPGKGTGAAYEVDTISGATISSSAVVDIINRALARLEPLLEAWAQEGTR